MTKKRSTTRNKGIEQRQGHRDSQKTARLQANGGGEEEERRRGGEEERRRGDPAFYEFIAGEPGLVVGGDRVDVVGAAEAGYSNIIFRGSAK